METTTKQRLRFKRVAAGDYETADARYRLYKLVDIYPPAWNVEDVSDPYTERLLVDGAATKRDALAIFYRLVVVE